VPKVWNMRDRHRPANAVYVGRPTKWGNPYVVGKDGTREECIEKYRKHFSEALVCAEVHDLKGKDLVCWCSPLPCHADILLEKANK